jgi:hypothetical protein
MKFMKFTLPAWVAAGLVAAAPASGADQSGPSGYEFGNYDYYAQADAPAPVDEMVPEVPPVTLMPRAGVPDEDVYQLRAAAPQEAAVEQGARRYLETDFLLKRGISTYGFVDVGIGANNWGAPWNGPITFNDRNWQAQMNQLYLINEKVLDEDFGWGGRIDLLYGTDYIYTVAAGLDAFRSTPDPLGLTGPRWGSSRYYGLAMPQLYAELGTQEMNVKFGHFYTLIGYEVVPAIGNFFYTHAYTMQYGEPFTHTGILGTWAPSDQFTLIGGITNGWDNWDDGLQTGGPILNTNYPDYNNNASLLGAVTLASADETQAFTFAITSGNQINGSQTVGGQDYNLVGNRTMFSVVYTNEINDKLTYVFQNDNGWSFNANPTYQNIGQQQGTAQWYGINQYLFWNFTDNLIGGLRFEWFRDNNGTRVAYGLRDGSPGAGEFAGNFWEMTWGLNYLLGSNVVIRPELRYDWYSPDAGSAGGLPYGNIVNGTGTEYGQFYGGCDVIWQF